MNNFHHELHELNTLVSEFESKESEYRLFVFLLRKYSKITFFGVVCLLIIQLVTTDLLFEKKPKYAYGNGDLAAQIQHSPVINWNISRYPNGPEIQGYKEEPPFKNWNKIIINPPFGWERLYPQGPFFNPPLGCGTGLR